MTSKVDYIDQRADAAAVREELTSLACSRNHALADSALVMVSWVVKVFRKENKALSLLNAAQHKVDFYYKVKHSEWMPFKMLPSIHPEVSSPSQHT